MAGYGVDFKVLYSDGKPPKDYGQQACFAQYIYYDKKHRENALHLVYDYDDALARENKSKFQSLVYMKDLEDMGIFHFTQDPAEIVESKQYVADLNMPRDQVFGTCNAIRYLTEYPDVVRNYLLIKQMMPNEDKWKLLQLAHFTAHEKLGEYPMISVGGHGMINNGYVRERYVTVDEVLAKYKEQPRANDMTYEKTELFTTFGVEETTKPAKGFRSYRTPADIITLHEQLDKEKVHAKAA